ncbi:hypothetical protein SCHPADRAFT_875677 [Schizopora paradoxa]|uniref:RhoGAP-domain-containing protein n=1 Tax=Schizopora paradoxa TaxID=27342 RepID=A0A0H2RS17_9AGAM|nr:hypothetical protein SCHPADRAFT_875677 [Schizopora paradoxa]
MLAAVPSHLRESTSFSAGPSTSASGEPDRFCAGCNRSVNSETGGVVVAFGNSLWHVDCFKCAKCGNLVNADTNLLLLSDGSPVCANCYNCKICNLPILDEAVMTGDDSYHAACFTCRSCRNRIDELVFAKTSQGFYCMKCHNERVARSRRHAAKQKQRERERQGTKDQSSRPGAGVPAMPSSTVDQNFLDISQSSSTSESSGSWQHQHQHQHQPPQEQRSSPSRINGYPDVTSVDANVSAANASFMSTNSVVDAAVLRSDLDHRSASPAPPAVSITVESSASPERHNGEERTLPFRRRSHSPDFVADVPTAATADGPPPPPYSITPPATQVSFDADSARSSASYGHSHPGSGPVSPPISRPTSYEQSRPGSSDRFAVNSPPDRSSSSSLGHVEVSVRSINDQGFLPDRRDSGSGKKYDDGTRPLSFLHPSTPASDRTVMLSPGQSKRSKRGSMNPGLQLEASRLQLDAPLASSSSQPNSPTPGSPNDRQLRRQSPTAGTMTKDSPRVSSPLREYFIGSEDEHADSDRSNVSNGTTFYSPATSPQQRGDTPSSQGHDTGSSHRSPPTKQGTLTPEGRRDFLAKLPQRSDSLRGGNGVAPLKSTAPTASRGRGQPNRGDLSLTGSSAPTLKAQRSFDEWDGRLSPRRAEFTTDGGKRSRSVSPKPPDVPTNVESGTDTEADGENEDYSEDITQSYLNMQPSPDDERQPLSDLPPVPPPKDTKNMIATIRQRSPSVDGPSPAITSDEESPPAVKERFDVQGPLTEQRTSAFFSAPALPPMRFSMNGADFREILNNLGGTNGGNNARADTGPSVAKTIEEEEAEDVAGGRTPINPATPSDSSPDLLSDVFDAAKKAAEHATPKANRRAATPDTILPRAGNSSTSNLPQASPTSPTRPDLPKRSPHRASRSEGAIKMLQDTSPPRSSSDSADRTSPKLPSIGINGRERLDSVASPPHANGSLPPEAPSQDYLDFRRPSLSKQDTSSDLVTRRLKEVVQGATDRGVDYIKIDKTFALAIISALERKADQVAEISGKLDGMNRSSQHMMDGLSVALDEYSQEHNARKNAEAEISRLKIELSGQAARLSALTSDDRRREVHRQLSKEITDNLSGLERDLSKLKVERDLTLAEVEELSATKASSPEGEEAPAATVSRSLTVRLDKIKRQYQTELVPLTEQKEELMREIRELKDARDCFIEETAVLNRRNEELAHLNAEYERRAESSNSSQPKIKSITPPQPKQSFDTWRSRPPAAPPMVNATSTASTASTATLYDESSDESRTVRLNGQDTPQPKGRGIQLRWPGNKVKDLSAMQGTVNGDGKGKKRVEHTFQQLSVLKFGMKCDHCGDKMWGSQLRCSGCAISIHGRCVATVQSACNRVEEQEESITQPALLQRSMFGRDLVEQVHADAKGGDRFVPVIVEKCIDAVDTLAMDYEGIYRKSGGSGQSKAITQLFERGNYSAFDLRDSETFNDISSVTSVMKNYFRALPNPLLTFDLHDAFVKAAGYREPQAKAEALTTLVKQLPSEHFYTLGHLMLHLNRVQNNSAINKMTARNLGVVFGPTLMRSSDPSQEFTDMAGKTLAIEWLIENAPAVFPAL